MGGFGRSVVLAACLAIERVDISGAAALGLFRIMRPGAITTRRQEAFLKSFKGAADVRRFAKLPLPDGGSVSAFWKRVTLSTGLSLVLGCRPELNVQPALFKGSALDAFGKHVRIQNSCTRCEA